jgi:hypothetical protein
VPSLVWDLVWVWGRFQFLMLQHSALSRLHGDFFFAQRTFSFFLEATEVIETALESAVHGTGRLLAQTIIGRGEARCVCRAPSGLTLHNLGGRMASSPKNSACSHFLETNILLRSWLIVTTIALYGTILFHFLQRLRSVENKLRFSRETRKITSVCFRQLM